MAIIENLFIHYKLPAQYLYAGENYVDVYKKVDKTFKRTQRFEDANIYDLTSENFTAISREFGSGPIGVVLNSKNYIFNIFEFEQIPFREVMKQGVVEWRLKKVFPENLADYDHQYFTLAKNKILSILIRKELKQHIETLFNGCQSELILFGNSTVNLINGIFKNANTPDFLLEIDRHICILAFQEKGIPYYIRKFRGGNEQETVGEILKTLNYVRNSYSKTPAAITIIPTDTQLDLAAVKQQLAQENVNHKDIKNVENFVLPG